MQTFTSPAELTAAVGRELGHSQWHRIDQDQVNTFADATGDHQWIHVDVERAKAGPFKQTIAHGYLTLSLLPVLVSEVYQVSGVRMGVNYGLNKVRFPAPVPVGTRVRASVTLQDVHEVEGGVQVVGRVTIEAEGVAKPVCVAEAVSRLYF
ncbi:MaoC family dehydratase [Goodfellowiella coeruleoviolacea]|uniref:Acyl dehydratase n=1 Tax=Goodfellowiella coeruleoviolacea TaxID=334858 RepID=A0AAE3KEV4_9PSEU|nr:MaoC family dehydratase [Goodfellowiella coeruleoviolacea]MCP2164225.1 Acyl dehydratase [Goodfellowiella coeruleoviolacea]